MSLNFFYDVKNLFENTFRMKRLFCGFRSKQCHIIVSYYIHSNQIYEILKNS